MTYVQVGIRYVLTALYAPVQSNALRAIPTQPPTGIKL